MAQYLNAQEGRKSEQKKFRKSNHLKINTDLSTFIFKFSTLRNADVSTAKYIFFKAM